MENDIKQRCVGPQKPLSKAMKEARMTNDIDGFCKEAQMNENKYCDECKFYLKKMFNKAVCTHPKAYRFYWELVKRNSYPLCYKQREERGCCEREGKLYEPK